MAELKIKADSGGGTVSLKGPATTNSNAAVSVTLPKASIDLSSAGTDGQFLKTDGAGTLSFATVSQQTNASNLSSGTLPAARIADDSIVEAKLDIHAAPSGTDKFLGYTSNGMEWAVPTAPTGWERVTRSTGLSNDQDIETTALFDGTYNQIMICLEQAVINTDNSSFGIKFKIDGSYITATTYKANCRQWDSDANNVIDHRNTGANRFNVVQGVGNASGEFLSGKIYINAPSSTAILKSCKWDFWGCSDSTHALYSTGQGTLFGYTNALQGVRLYGTVGGDLGTSTISTYGLKL